MKFQFTLVIDGHDSLEKKFNHAIQNNPDLNMNLVQGMGQILTLGFGFNVADGIRVESFRAGKLVEEAEKISEKPVESVPENNNQQQEKTPEMPVEPVLENV